MDEMVTLIGDVVGSRALPDRTDAQRRLGAVLADVGELVPRVQPLEPTVGDGFQGAFPTLADASLAALLVRLSLLPDVDVRCGLGEGGVVVHDADRRPLLQDGPGWWAAREALEVLGRPRHKTYRTWYVGPAPARAASLNAFLLTRDALVDRLGDRARRMLAASLRGASQVEIAEREGISKSAVSQQFARGVGAVRDAHRALVDVAGPSTGRPTPPAGDA